MMNKFFVEQTYKFKYTHKKYLRLGLKNNSNNDLTKYSTIFGPIKFNLKY